jgi:RNA polymerase sigma-70 factor, ECF subfamily
VQSLDALTNPEEGAPMEFSGEEPSPLHLVLTHEAEGNVQASLTKLPAIYREVLLLRFQEELGLAEIAAVLAAPVSTVKSRLYRGLEELRGLLQGEAA